MRAKNETPKEFAKNAASASSAHNHSVSAGSGTEHFLIEMQLHRKRVWHLATGCFHAFETEFSELNEELVKAYFLLHDAPKVQDLGELKAQGYLEAEPLCVLLAGFYGTNLKDLRGSEKKQLQAAIANLNRLEKKLKHEFFVARQLSQIQIEKLGWLEMIVDTTDTGLARRTEMDLPGIAYNGAAFLLKQKGDRKASRLSRWLEDHYELASLQHG